MPATILEQAADALVALDGEKLVSLYAPGFLFEDTSAKERITTRDRLKAYFDQLFGLPGVSFSDVEFFAFGVRGAGTWTWNGKSRASGLAFSIQGASMFILGDNGIKEEKIYYDPRDALA